MFVGYEATPAEFKMNRPSALDTAFGSSQADR